MPDQRKTERDDPQRTSRDDERVRGIGDPDRDDLFEDEDDLDEEEPEEDEEAGI
jgi:hypothetical protein